MDALDIIFNKSGFRPAVFTSHSKASLGGYGGGAGGGLRVLLALVRLSAWFPPVPRAVVLVSRVACPSRFSEWLVRVSFPSGLSESVF